MTTTKLQATRQNEPMTLSDAQFAELSKFAFSEAGLIISESKRQMIQSRLIRHMREINCENLNTYIGAVKSDRSGKTSNDLISVLTTNVSSFFREKHHFDILEEKLLPRILKKARQGEKVRIWSAGCSSGQEPYSLAMLLLSKVPDIESLNMKILATDIDQRILDKARRAVYSNDEIGSVPAGLRKRYVEKSPSDTDQYLVSNTVKNLVTLRPLNLLREWPMKRRFDAIFCRNVLIYFDGQTQNSLWPRFNAALDPQGYLFLGHSERIQNAEKIGFTPTGVTTYQKT